MPGDAYILWTERGLSCRVSRQAEGWQVSVAADEGAPFLRRFAHSRGDAGNQAEYLRVLLDRSHGAVRRRERIPLVLIVEDDAENLFAYEETLKLDGFRTASASSIGAARQLMREIKPAAILLDHILPDGDGQMFARELRHASDERVPIVLVTGLDPATVAGSYGTAADALLAKPCRPETLTGVLKLLVERSSAHKPAKIAAGAREPLGRACCPLCGVTGALVDAAGGFHCQQCGKEGRFDRDLYVDTHS
jgi:CheY-like chemotaxis protein